MKLDVSTPQSYDIACALRGPDLNLEFDTWFKALVTARIRFLTGAEVGSWYRRSTDDPNCCLQVATSPAIYSNCFSSAETLLERHRSQGQAHLQSAREHYIGHAHDALVALATMGLGARDHSLLTRFCDSLSGRWFNDALCHYKELQKIWEDK